MAARPENPVPYEDADHNSLPPPVAAQISMDIEAYDRKIAAMEKMGWAKTDTSLLWMETAVRKDQYVPVPVPVFVPVTVCVSSLYLSLALCACICAICL